MTKLVLSRPMHVPIAFATALLIQACGEPPPPPEPVIRPVRYITATPADPGRMHTFSGLARAGVESSLSFRIPGTMARLAANVGDRVEMGQVLAELDPVDYELQVREAEAAVRQAEARSQHAGAELRRARSLYENDNASRTDLDAATAAAESAAATVVAVEKRLELAQRQLLHTRLSAPAAGAIASVLAEENENVAAGQPVVSLASGSAPEVGLAVPEALIQDFRKGMDVSIAFDAFPGRRFRGAVSEVGVTAGATRTTFPVTVRLGTDASSVLPGMTAAVEIQFAADGAEARFVVPSHAVGQDRTGHFLFVAEPTGGGLGVVRRRAVTPGPLAQGGIEVMEGLSQGDRVVVAGISRLQDGRQVRLDAAGAR